VLVIFISCKKEYSCENCREKNRPPIAIAGPDRVITLPTNTVTLDGSGSTDPDNNITSYAWVKISGPSSFNMVNINAVQTQVANLVQGKYQFKLKVTDAAGLFSKDIVQIEIIDSLSGIRLFTRVGGVVMIYAETAMFTGFHLPGLAIFIPIPISLWKYLFF